VTALALPPFGTLAGEVARAGLVGLAFLAIFAIAEGWRRFFAPPVEWTRKFVHFAGGVIAALFPWVFGSHWTVLALGAAFFLILWGTRRLGVLDSVHGVARASQGGLYYPAAIYIVFLIGAGRPVFYLISVLALVVSDTAAAILGSAYGRISYDVETDRRSVEGSAVFFISTFLVVHLPLLLLTDLPEATCVILAVQLALLVTLLEGISIGGNDNLLVPLATYYFLLKMTTKSPAFLGYQLGAQLTIIVLLGAIAWRFQFLSASGAMALSLFAYGAYALGGEEWIVAPAIAILAFSIFYLARTRPAAPAGPASGQFQVVATFYATIVPAVVFLANNAFETMYSGAPSMRTGDPLYPFYVGCVAGQLALITYNIEPGVRLRPSTRVAGAMAVAAFTLVVPVGLLVGVRPLNAPDFAVASAIVVLASLLYHTARRLTHWHAALLANLRMQTASVLIAALLLLPVWFAQRL